MDILRVGAKKDRQQKNLHLFYLLNHRIRVYYSAIISFSRPTVLQMLLTTLPQQRIDRIETTKTKLSLQVFLLSTKISFKFKN